MSKRIEKITGQGRYPSEVVWTETGTWIIPDLPLGAWTDRTQNPGETEHDARLTGGRITQDELHWTVIGQAQAKGWQLPSEDTALLSACAVKLDINSPAKGKASLDDPALSTPFADLAHRGVAWLNSNVAPPGRHFILEDALYLIED